MDFILAQYRDMSALARYAERIGGARFEEAADCGHAMYFERPAEFAGLVASFLSGASR